MCHYVIKNYAFKTIFSHDHMYETHPASKRRSNSSRKHLIIKILASRETDQKSLEQSF